MGLVQPIHVLVSVGLCGKSVSGGNECENYSVRHFCLLNF